MAHNYYAYMNDYRIAQATVTTSSIIIKKKTQNCDWFFSSFLHYFCCLRRGKLVVDQTHLDRYLCVYIAVSIAHHGTNKLSTVHLIIKLCVILHTTITFIGLIFFFLHRLERKIALIVRSAVLNELKNDLKRKEREEKIISDWETNAGQ